MSWLSRMFPVRSLDEVGQGADVALEVRVASPDAVESALAPIRAAAFQWTLTVQHTVQDRGGQSSRLLPFASGWRGGPILVRASCGRAIELGLEQTTLVAAIDPEDGVPLGDSPRSAEIYGAVAARVPPTGVVFVREHAITHGQKLWIAARVTPTPRGSGGYRDAAPASEAAFVASGPVRVEDRALEG